MHVYLDHNATTPLRPEAREAFLEALDRVRGNPSSVHAPGRAARMLLDEARERLAGALGVLEDELAFTSGGTEADNWAILGGLASLGADAHLVTTPMEHPAVRVAAEEALRVGIPVEWAPVDAWGRVDLDRMVALAQPGGMVAAMAANSEVGTLTNVSELAERLRARFGTGPRPLLFSDAVQALGRIPVDLRAWNVDLAAFSAHKVGGPLGVGVLYRRTGTALEPRLVGGGQEGGLRSGTENVPAIVAASVAFELAIQEQAVFHSAVGEIMGKMWKKLVENVPGVVLNGPPIDSHERLPNTLNVRLPGAQGQVLVTQLDLQGLHASAGSACSSGSVEPSAVLRAMGQTDEHARAGLRLSAGRTTTEQETHTAVEILSKTFCSERNS